MNPELYDEVTGLGTPIVNLFVPDLIAWPKSQTSTPFKPVTISGQTFNDLNGNGARIRASPASRAGPFSFPAAAR